MYACPNEFRCSRSAATELATCTKPRVRRRRRAGACCALVVPRRRRVSIRVDVMTFASSLACSPPHPWGGGAQRRWGGALPHQGLCPAPGRGGPDARALGVGRGVKSFPPPAAAPNGREGWPSPPPRKDGRDGG